MSNLIVSDSSLFLIIVVVMVAANTYLALNYVPGAILSASDVLTH